MGSLLTNQSTLSSHVTESLMMDLDERNIEGRHSKMGIMEFFKDFTGAVVKLIYCLVNKVG